MNWHDINSDDYRFLYDLPRHPITFEKPTYQEHCDFCLNHPYLVWRVSGIGQFYITDRNEIGINLTVDKYREVLDYITENHQPLPAVPSVRAGDFVCNVSPSNTKLINACGPTKQITCEV